MHRPHHHCNKIPAIEFDDTDTHRIYLMLDGGQLPELELQLFEVSESPAYQPLYLYAPWDSLREVSPCLVEANERRCYPNQLYERGFPSPR